MLKILNVTSKEKLTIKLTANFMAVCPVDNNPDFYTIKIMFIPNECTLEIISLRHYLSKYNSKSILAENLIATIADDLIKSLKPKKLLVKLTNVAEGIEIKINQKEKKL